MPRVCAVCSHLERQAIEAALLAGTSNREIFALFRVSKDSQWRHKAEHLPAKLATAHEAEQVSQADDLLSQVRALHTKALSILAMAETAGELRTALSGVREARGCLELEAKLRGELNERPQVNVWLPAPWQDIETAIIAALAPYPPAKVAVAAALMELDRAKLN